MTLHAVPDPPPDRLFAVPDPVEVYPPDVRDLADQLHDQGHFELGHAVLDHYLSYDRVVKAARALLELGGGDAA